MANYGNSFSICWFYEVGNSICFYLIIFSYVPATFVIESMAISNALKRNRQSSHANEENANEDEEPLTESQIKSSDFEIDVKYELVIMFSTMFYILFRVNFFRILLGKSGLFSFM